MTDAFLFISYHQGRQTWGFNRFISLLMDSFSTLRTACLLDPAHLLTAQFIFLHKAILWVQAEDSYWGSAQKRRSPRSDKQGWGHMWAPLNRSTSTTPILTISRRSFQSNPHEQLGPGSLSPEETTPVFHAGVGYSGWCRCGKSTVWFRSVKGLKKQCIITHSANQVWKL